MAFFNEFPHTRTYDSDLGWLIKEVKEWADKYEDLVEFQEQIDEWKAGIDADLTSMQQQLSGYEQRFQQLSTDLYNQIVALQNDLEHEIDTRLNEIDLMVTQLILDIEQRMSALARQLMSLIESNNQLNRQYIETRLAEFIESLPEYTAENIFIHNPVKGRTDSLQNTINDLYELSRVDGLTAAEYDALQLTAEEYDDLELTAYEYDNYGRRFLGIGVNLIRSPFDGSFQSVETLIWRLAGLHKDDLTAAEYDALELTAEEYDFEEITAYDYDWNGKTYSLPREV